jgi:hypothetical protein
MLMHYNFLVSVSFQLAVGSDPRLRLSVFMFFKTMIVGFDQVVHQDSRECLNIQ